MIRMQEGTVFDLCTKFEVDSLFVQISKAMRGSKISKLGHVTQDTPT